MQVRRAVAEDRDLLDEMTLAGVRHWGHHEHHPEAYQGLVRTLTRESDPQDHPVFVFENDQNEVIGFYELRDRGDHMELLRMFLRPGLIGKGYGRLLWDQAAAEAARSHERLLINSDPGATGFYRRWGQKPSAPSGRSRDSSSPCSGTRSPRTSQTSCGEAVGHLGQSLSRRRLARAGSAPWETPHRRPHNGISSAVGTGDRAETC